MSSTDRIASRIAAAYLVARPRAAALVGDPKRLLDAFEAAVHKLAFEVDPPVAKETRRVLEQEERENLPYSPEISRANRVAYGAYLRLAQMPLNESGHALFLSILQSYTLPPKLLKQVEMASREYLKSRAPSLPRKGRYLAALTAYERVVEMARKHVEVARAAIAQGKEHGTEGEGATKVKVGPFTLVNTGGFPPDLMREVGDLVRQAAEHIQRAGFGEVLYGDVHVTNTIRSSPNILAFYLVEKDEMFIRANAKAAGKTVYATIHELGHRMENKFLRGGERAAAALYRAIKTQEFLHGGPKYEDRPSPGEKLVEKGVTYSVLTTERTPQGNYKVILKPEDPGFKPGVRISLSLEGWLERMRGSSRNPEAADHKGFVSEYAKKSPSENFAEMFYYYCVNKLNPALRALFEETVFGASKTVH